MVCNLAGKSEEAKDAANNAGQSAKDAANKAGESAKQTGEDVSKKTQGVL